MIWLLIALAVAVPVAYLYGIWLGLKRGAVVGYEQGQDDTLKQVSAW